MGSCGNGPPSSLGDRLGVSPDPIPGPYSVGVALPVSGLRGVAVHASVIDFVGARGIEDEPAIASSAVNQRLAIDDIVRQFVRFQRNPWLTLLAVNFLRRLPTHS